VSGSIFGAFFFYICRMKLLTFILLLVLTTAGAFAQQITINKSDLPPEVLSAVQSKLDSADIANKINRYGNWVGIGHEIGIATDESFRAISRNSQELADSNLGHFIMFLIGYRIVGADILKKLIGILLIMVWIVLFIWYYRNNCNPLYETTTVIAPDKTKTITRTVKDERDSEDNGTERFIGALVFVGVGIGICVGLIA